MPAIADPEVGDEKLVIPPTVQINKMSDRFKEAMNKGVPALEDRPPEKPPEKPPEPPVTKPAEPPPTSKVPEPPKAPEPPKEPVKDKPKIPAENFKLLESQRDELKAKHEAAEAKLKELEAKLSVAVDPAKITELEEKIAQTTAKANQYETIVEKFYVEHSPQFQASFTNKINETRVEAKEAVGSEHASKIESLLKLPPGESRDRALEEVGDELRPFQQSALVKAYSDLKRIERSRDEALSNASESYKKLQEYNAEETRKQNASTMATLENAFKAEAGAFMAKLPDFRLIEGDEARNAKVKGTLEFAKNCLDPALSPVERARVGLWAAKGYASLETDAAKDALIAKLTAQVQSLQSPNPTVDGGGKAPSTEAKPKTAGEKYNEAMSRGVPKRD